MKIYHPGSRGKHTIFVCPGQEFPVSDFLDADGKPIQFPVGFSEGAADVPDNLGNYMIDRDLAKKSPIILLEFA